MEKIIINIIIGIIAIGGFFWYWGRSSGVFKEGGVIYEWWKNYCARKKEEKNSQKLNKKD